MSAVVRGVLTVVLGLALTTAPAAAQDTPVVFVHGFNSSQQAWQAAAARLAASLRIEPHAVDVPWRDSFEAQATALQSAKGHLPSSTIVVAHSQGGVASRQWSQSKPLFGILTLGTPHTGSLLAQRGLDVIRFNYTLYNLIGLATSFGAGTQFEWIYVLLRSYYNVGLQLSWGTATSVAATTAVMHSVPVAPQLVPGSAFMTGLNGPGNLARESSAIQRRVGLTFAADDYWRGGVAVGLAPNQREWAWTAMLTLPPTFEYAAAYVEQYYGPLNMAARSFAASLRNIAGGIRELDPLWCWAVTDDRQCRVPHDGIVSAVNQHYPGGLNFSVAGPAHTQETDRSDREISSVLTGVMGVTTRASAPPPPPGGGSGGGPGTLTAGMRLYPDQEVVSPGGTTRLLYQTDGNLVLYASGGVAVWASDTVGYSAGHATLQGDGNLVVYDAEGVPRWASGTSADGAYLRVYDEGHVTVHDASGVGLWWSGSGNP